MPYYQVYCTWAYGALVRVEANSKEEARQKVEADTEMPDGDYEDGSFGVVSIEEEEE